MQLFKAGVSPPGLQTLAMFFASFFFSSPRSLSASPALAEWYFVLLWVPIFKCAPFLQIRNRLLKSAKGAHLSPVKKAGKTAFVARLPSVPSICHGRRTIARFRVFLWRLSFGPAPFLPSLRDADQWPAGRCTSMGRSYTPVPPVRALPGVLQQKKKRWRNEGIKCTISQLAVLSS